jgi:hypothetical protein
VDFSACRLNLTDLWYKFHGHNDVLVWTLLSSTVRENVLIWLLGNYEHFKKALHHVVSYFYVILGYIYSMKCEVLEAERIQATSYSNVRPCCLTDRHKSFPRNCCSLSIFIFISKMEESGSCEMLLYICQTTRCHIPENRYVNVLRDSKRPPVRNTYNIFWDVCSWIYILNSYSGTDNPTYLGCSFPDATDRNWK